MNTMVQRRIERRAKQYARSVIEVLERDLPEFDESGRDVIERALVRHVLDGGDLIEVIVDEPMRANWRLHQKGGTKGKVRLGDHHLSTRVEHTALCEFVNAQLAAL